MRSVKNICLLLRLLFFSLFLFSCVGIQHQEITDNYITLNVNNSAIPDTLDIASIVDTVELLKLENVPQKQVGFIGQLYALEGRYIVADPVITKRVNAYDSHGSFIKTIMENGVADSNALNLTDCYVNENSEIIVYDFAQMKITAFDSVLKRKAAIKGEKLFHYNHIASIPGSDGFVGYSSYNDLNTYLQKSTAKASSLDILNDSLALSKKYLRYSKKFENIAAISFSKSFFLFKDSLRFFRAYDPFIYNISKNGVQRRYKIVYSKGNFPDNFLESMVEPHLNEVKLSGRSSKDGQSLYLYCNGFTSVRGWLEADSLIYLSSINFHAQNMTGFSSIVSQSGRSPEVLSARNFVDNKRFRISFPEFKEYDRINNQFIAFCTGYELKKRLFGDSPLRNMADIVDDCFYLIKVRFATKSGQ